jgi:hypothetical protein
MNERKRERERKQKERKKEGRKKEGKEQDTLTQRDTKGMCAHGNPLETSRHHPLHIKERGLLEAGSPATFNLKLWTLNTCKKKLVLFILPTLWRV